MNWEVIEENQLFKKMSREDLLHIFKCSKTERQSYRRGEMIFRPGEQARYLYVLLKGRVTLSRYYVTGKKNTLYEVRADQIFGEHYIFGKEPVYKYCAKAMSDVELLKIPGAYFSGYCSEQCQCHRDLIHNMLEVLSEKEWMAIKKVNIVSSVSLKERISTWLLDEAEADDIVRLEMNREELADYLGVARPSLSRALMKMQNEGLIEVGKKSIRILQREEIEKYL